MQVGKQPEGSAEHVDAGRHHRRGMDQRGDRRGTLHRIWQPHVQGHLGGFAQHAAEDQQADQRQGVVVERAKLQQVRQADLQELIVEGALRRRRTGKRPEHQDAHKEAEIGDSVNHERLLAGFGRGRPLIPMTDQGIRGKSDQLPAHEELQPVVGQDNGQHREGKQRQDAEVSAGAGVLRHVADRVDENRAAHAGDDQCHQQREPVDQDAKWNRQIRQRHPTEADFEGKREASGQSLGKQIERAAKREEQSAHGQACAQALARQAHQHDAGRGHQWTEE